MSEKYGKWNTLYRRFRRWIDSGVFDAGSTAESSTELKSIYSRKPLLMDKADEGDECRQKVRECGMKPIVQPKSNRKKPWRYRKKLYKRRNIAERNLRKIKEFRRVFTRYDKPDETCNAFIALANIAIYLKN